MTLCVTSSRHASKPVQFNSYYNLSPGSLEKRLDLQLKVIFTEARPTLLNFEHNFSALKSNRAQPNEMPVLRFI